VTLECELVTYCRPKSPEPIRALTEDQYRSVPLTTPPPANPLQAGAPLYAPSPVPVPVLANPTPRSPPPPVTAPPPQFQPPAQAPPPVRTAERAVVPQREAEPLPPTTSAERPPLVSPTSPFEANGEEEPPFVRRDSPSVPSRTEQSAIVGSGATPREGGGPGAAVAAIPMAVGNGVHHRPPSEGVGSAEQAAEIDMYVKELRAVAALEVGSGP